MRHEFHITEADAGRRLDRWLQAALGDVPFSLVRRLLRQKEVKVNGRRGRPDTTLATGDEVVVHHRTRSKPERERAPVAGPYRGPAIEALHRDDLFLFVDKPPVVSCSDDGRDGASLPRWLAETFAREIAAGTLRPEPCHRLDRGTSGVVAVALVARAHELFRRALEDGRVEKSYEVVVRGAPAEEEWTCDLPLRRVTHARRREPRMVAAAAGEDGAQDARTHFRVLRRAGGLALLRAEPRTGRTHQIRAHCHAQGLPVVGDPRYGAQGEPEDDGQMLHARRLRAVGDEIDFDVDVPWPAERRARLEEWGLL